MAIFMPMEFTPAEIEAFRDDTPGCRQVIHFNNAGASLMPSPVLEAITQHLQLESLSGGYEAAALRVAEIRAFYPAAARLLNCTPAEIVYTNNATDGFSRALSSIPFERGDVILTTKEDYISNQVTFLSLGKRLGTRLVRAESLPTGGVDLDSMEECLATYRPRLVAVTHIPTNSGLIQPVKEIGALCERYGTLYLLDACQSVGQLTLDVRDIKCDFLSVAVRKFLRGPRGAGFLYVSEDVLNKGLEPLFIDMRGAEWVAADSYEPRADASRFENWEVPHALLLGARAAIEYALRIGMARIEERVLGLADHIRSRLNTIDGVTICDRGQRLGGLITFHLDGSDPIQIKRELSGRRINTDTSLRAYAVIDFDEKGVGWAIRVSPHYYNTIEEADLLLEAVASIAKNKKQITL
jgi:selenocysteine lyase/cysteine desulfurase